MASRSSNAAIFVPQENNIDDGTIRIIFKTYFIVLLIFIGLIGNRCCRLLVRYKLLRNHIVLLPSTTGWIQGPSYFKILWHLRRMPGGWLGWLMLLATILDLVGDYAVSKNVTKYPEFIYYEPSEGMILNESSITPLPSINWEAYRYASRAQIYGITNARVTGSADEPVDQYGIYRMITNDTSFMADENSMIGYWSCSATTPQPIPYDQSFKGTAAEIFDDDIWSDLTSRGLLFKDGYSSNVSSIDSYEGPSTHTTILTASTMTTGELFEIRAAVDTLDIDQQGSKQMHTFACELHSLEPENLVESIARVIDIEPTLSGWIDEIVGSMFPGMHADHSYPINIIEHALQWYLNSMIMVAGSNEEVTTPNVERYQILIFEYGTIIPYWVIAICVVIWLLASFLVCYAIFLWFANRAAAHVYDRSNRGAYKVESREIRENAPNGMLEWMTHAAYESRDADRIPQRNHLHKWILSTTWHAGRRLGIVRVSEHGQVNPLRTPGMTQNMQSSYGQQYQQYPGQEMGYFPTQKGEYISVNTREVL